MDNFLEEYLKLLPDPRSPFSMATALRKQPEQPSPSPSPAPGIQAKPADVAPPPQVGDSRWDPEFTASYMDMAGLSSEDQGLASKGELIDSLRGRRYKTGIGGGIGAAGEVLATIASLQNIEKRQGVRDRYMDEFRKSLTRNSATGGREVDPTRDL